MRRSRFGPAPTSHLLLLPGGMKKCKSCPAILPVSSFWKDRTVAAGVCSNCPDCMRKRRSDKHRAWRLKNLDKSRATAATYRKNHPDKDVAHIAVSVAIKTKGMPSAKTMACVGCGDQAAEYDHYLGYAPEHHLDVEPMCRTCHALRERRRRGNAPQAACWFDIVEGAAPWLT